MITKNEMVAILAALSTDLDAAAKRAAADVRKAEEQARRNNNRFFLQRDRFQGSRPHAS